MPPHLEIPIFGPASAAAAIASGARRLELNREGSYATGGTTPTLTELSSLRAICNPQSHTTIRVMIRPKGPPPPSPSGNPQQDFIYTPEELHLMASSIDQFRTSGLLDAQKGDGFVFGALTTSGTSLSVDTKASAYLVERAGPFPCVFHRAFDEVVTASGEGEAWRTQLGEVVACGFGGVLTSGGRGSACDGENAVRLGEIVAAAEGRMEVVVGGGVRRGNVRGIVEGMGGGGWKEWSVWFHSSCLVEDKFDEEEAAELVRELSLFTS